MFRATSNHRKRTGLPSKAWESRLITSARRSISRTPITTNQHRPSIMLTTQQRDIDSILSRWQIESIDQAVPDQIYPKSKCTDFRKDRQWLCSLELLAGKLDYNTAQDQMRQKAVDGILGLPALNLIVREASLEPDVRPHTKRKRTAAETLPEDESEIASAGDTHKKKKKNRKRDSSEQDGSSFKTSSDSVAAGYESPTRVHGSATSHVHAKICTVPFGLSPDEVGTMSTAWKMNNDPSDDGPSKSQDGKNAGSGSGAGDQPDGGPDKQPESNDDGNGDANHEDSDWSGDEDLDPDTETSESGGDEASESKQDEIHIDDDDDVLPVDYDQKSAPGSVEGSPIPNHEGGGNESDGGKDPAEGDVAEGDGAKESGAEGDRIHVKEVKGGRDRPESNERPQEQPVRPRRSGRNIQADPPGPASSSSAKASTRTKNTSAEKSTSTQKVKGKGKADSTPAVAVTKKGPSKAVKVVEAEASAARLYKVGIDLGWEYRGRFLENDALDAARLSELKDDLGDGKKYVGQVKNSRYIYRIIETEDDLDHWIGNEKGPRPKATHPRREADVAALYRQIKDLLDMRKMIRGEWIWINDMDGSEAKFIKALEGAKKAYAEALNGNQYLPEAWQGDHMKTFREAN